MRIQRDAPVGGNGVSTMIDIRKLKELVRLMVENDLAELDLHDQQETVTIKRGDQGQPVIVAPAQQASALPAVPAQAQPATDNTATQAQAAPAVQEDPDAGLVPIVSPMVGTFYAAANPDSPPFVSIGASISPETVVCFVEAMKVFNEIKAEASGTIERVLVKNGDAVEFGQELFLFKPT